jgi:hypothetical protein
MAVLLLSSWLYLMANLSPEKYLPVVCPMPELKMFPESMLLFYIEIIK